MERKKFEYLLMDFVEIDSELTLRCLQNCVDSSQIKVHHDKHVGIDFTGFYTENLIFNGKPYVAAASLEPRIHDDDAEIIVSLFRLKYGY